MSLAGFSLAGDYLPPGPLPTPGPVVGQTAGYEAAAKDLIHYQQLYLNDLHLLLHVFRRALLQALPAERNKEVDSAVFGPLGEVQELTVKTLRLLEDGLEMGDPVPRLGAVFLDLAEGAEFDVYLAYAQV